MKASLKCLSDPTHWIKALPLVLLGTCTALKQDLQCTAVELVYGTTLYLLGEYFHQHTNATLDPISFVSQLKTLMQSVEHTATSTVTDTPASRLQTPTAAISPPETDLPQ